MLLTSAVLLLCSCDKNKKKIEEITNQFITAVNDNDYASVYDIYPIAQNLTNMTLVRNIVNGEVLVERDDSTGLYTVTIQNPRQQKLLFSVDSLGALSVIDSYGILQLDSLSRELALKCGMPLKHVSDMGQAKLMDEKSLFFTYLKGENAFIIEGTLFYFNNSSCSCGIRDGYPYCRIYIPIINSGKRIVEGSEYSVEVKCYKGFDSDYPPIIKTFDGVNISPDETHIFEINDPALFDWAFDGSLRWNVNIHNHDNSLITRLLKYGEFTGKEYNNFIEVQDDYFVHVNGKPVLAKNEKKGHVDCYAEPSKKSPITGTAYHRQLITVVCNEKLPHWSKAYNESKVPGRYTLLGYIHNDEWEFAGDLTALYIDKLSMESKDGNDIAIYKKESTKSDIVKKVKAGSKFFFDRDDYYSDFVAVYEPDGKGGYKIVGYVQSININFDE